MKNKLIELYEIPTCSETEFNQSVALTKQYAPDPVPAGWQEQPFPEWHPLYGAKCYRRTGDSLAMLLTASPWPGDKESERIWLHVSLSRPNKMPSYSDMCDVKAVFVGAHRKALQIFPEQSQHVNIHNYCLHLWCAVEGSIDIPEFGAMGTI